MEALVLVPVGEGERRGETDRATRSGGGGSTEKLWDGRSGLPSAGHGFTCGY